MTPILEAPHPWGELACNTYTGRAHSQGFLARDFLVLSLELVGCFGHTEGVNIVIVVDGQVSSKIQSGDKVENLCVGILCVDAEDTGDFAFLTILALEAVATELISEEVKLYSQHTLSVTVENGSSEVACPAP